MSTLNTFKREDSGTNTVLSIAEFYHTSSGTPASGLGSKLVLGSEDSAGNAQEAVELQGYLSTVTSTSEQGEFLMRLINAGSMQTVFSVTTGSNTASFIAAQTTLNLFNTVATTVNAFGAATTCTMGGGGAATCVLNFVTIRGNTSTLNLCNSVSTTINFAGAATTLSIGSASGTATINNANTVVTGDLAVNGGDMTTSATTFNLLTTNVTTLNLALAATTVNFSATGLATTYNFLSSSGGTALFSPTTVRGTSGTVSLWNTVSTTINFAGGASTALNIGNTAGPITCAGIVVGPATTTSRASFRAPHGTAPSAPTDGDIWTTTAGLYVRINGSTVGPLS